jgi:hypothetical protein
MLMLIATACSFLSARGGLFRDDARTASVRGKMDPLREKLEVWERAQTLCKRDLYHICFPRARRIWGFGQVSPGNAGKQGPSSPIAGEERVRKDSRIPGWNAIRETVLSCS